MRMAGLGCFAALDGFGGVGREVECAGIELRKSRVVSADA